MQLVPIDLAEVLIGLEEEWKWVRKHKMMFRISEMLVKNSKIYKNLSFGNTQGIQYSIVSGYAKILNYKMKKLLKAYFVCQTTCSFYTK